jgi:GTP-binding protein
VLRALRTQVIEARQIALEDDIDAVDGEYDKITLGENQIAEGWTVEKRTDDETGESYYLVTGDKIEKFARRTDYDNFEGLNRLRDIMKKLGINHELRRQGAEGDSVIRIGDHDFTYLEQ